MRREAISELPLPYAPRFNGNLNADIALPLSSELNVLSGLNVAFTDSCFTDGTMDPVGEQSSHSQIDLRVGIGSQDGRWTVSVIGKNITDEFSSNFTETFLDVYRGFIQAPRPVWLQER